MEQDARGKEHGCGREDERDLIQRCVAGESQAILDQLDGGVGGRRVVADGDDLAERIKNVSVSSSPMSSQQQHTQESPTIAYKTTRSKQRAL